MAALYTVEMFCACSRERCDNSCFVYAKHAHADKHITNADRFEQVFGFRPFKTVPINPRWWDEKFKEVEVERND